MDVLLFCTNHLYMTIIGDVLLVSKLKFNVTIHFFILHVTLELRKEIYLITNV